MHLTFREVWTAVHGMVFGAGFLLLFSGGFIAIWNLDTEGLTREAAGRQLRRLNVGAWGMAIVLWAAVILGTYWVYPWYRATPPAGAAFTDYPKSLLISNPQTVDWHGFGMEWKEHIAWLAPILVTAVLAIVICHGRLLLSDAKLRRFVLFLFSVAFFCASVAGVFGALINKAAPTR
jgi:phosphoglycerol transferase MdoB-like AlkP superfamily enzyme